MGSQQFIYRLTLRRPALLQEGPTAAEEKIIFDHFNYLQELHSAGEVALAGRTDTQTPDTFGIVILKVADADRATCIMQNDPAVREKVMNAELFPFRIALPLRD